MGSSFKILTWAYVGYLAWRYEILEPRCICILLVRTALATTRSIFVPRGAPVGLLDSCVIKKMVTVIMFHTLSPNDLSKAKCFRMFNKGSVSRFSINTMKKIATITNRLLVLNFKKWRMLLYIITLPVEEEYSQYWEVNILLELVAPGIIWSIMRRLHKFTRTPWTFLNSIW